MTSSIGRIAWECFTDLGITVVYATLAGLLIVGVVASDDGTSSLFATALCASLLPASVALLIAADIVLRARAVRRSAAVRVAVPSAAVPSTAWRASRS